MNAKLNQLVESLDGCVLQHKVEGSKTLSEIYFYTFTLDLTYSDKGWKFRFVSLVETLKFECDTIWYLDFDDLKKKLESTIVRFNQVQPDYSVIDFDYPEDDEESESEKAHWAKRKQESDDYWKAFHDDLWEKYSKELYEEFCNKYRRLDRTDMLR
jgi:hypothetical protein